MVAENSRMQRPATRWRLATVAMCALSIGCARTSSSTGGAGSATPADAKTFLDHANETTLTLGIAQSQAGWVEQNFITDDTEAIAARANQAAIEAGARFAKESTKYDKVDVPADQRRMVNLLKTSLVLAAPSDPKESDELTKIMARLESAYGKGKWCPDPSKPDTCKNIDDVTHILSVPGNEKVLREAWEGGHTISPPMKKDYQRFVELSNKGARELGFPDTGAMWRAKYDMPPDEFTKELDRLWDQVRPLYLKLHAYTRMKLHEKYGDLVPATGPIPAHLLGNIWAQDWSNIYPLVAPPNADAGFNLTDILKKRKMPALDMARTGEHFYTSLGFAPLPKTFWERSLFVRPRDREVVCHASAWDVDYVEDVRIKMCIEPTAEDFTTIHHELGHNFYQRAYKDLPLKYQGVAPPSARGEEFFDPGAKYHVPDNTPYTRYFLAAILQFQFHRALSKIAGCTLPLNRCSTYESQEAGKRLNAMLSMGQSRPWPDALETLAGSRQMDATAIIDYFAPLSKWLDDQLKGKAVGW